MNEDEHWFINRLADSSISEADLYGCIDILEMMLSTESVPILVNLMQNVDLAFAVRLRAAIAVKCIDAPIGTKLMSELANEDSQDLKNLIELAKL